MISKSKADGSSELSSSFGEHQCTAGGKAMMSADFRDDTDASESSSEPMKSKQSLNVKDTCSLSVMRYKVIFERAYTNLT